MKLSKQEILNLHGGLNAVESLGGAKFSYCIAKNLSKIKPEIEALQKAYLAKKEFVDYDKERQSLAQSHAVKVDGKPQTIIENGAEKYAIEDQNKFDAELKVLQEKHKTVIDERQKQLDDFTDILKEEVEIELSTLSPEYLPKDITAKQTSGILLIIEEERLN